MARLRPTLGQWLLLLAVSLASTNALRTQDCDPIAAPDKCHFFLRGAHLETGLHPSGTFGSKQGNSLLGGKSMADASDGEDDTDPAFFRSYKALSKNRSLPYQKTGLHV